MDDDKRNALKKKMAERMNSASERLSKNLGGRIPGKSPTQRMHLSDKDQLSWEILGTKFEGETDSDTNPIGTFSDFGNDAPAIADRPLAPVGMWRCIVNSDLVSIDLIATIAPNGTLMGRGTIIYVMTNYVYNVSGQGDWRAMPPDASSPSWLFHFRMHPSNHSIFSWFARPTETPGLLLRRFVVPDSGAVIETSCKRIS